MGQLGSLVARAVQRDSFVHHVPITAHTLRASCVHRWTPHRTRRLALTRAHPPLSLRAPRVTPHGPVDHALCHSSEMQSSWGRKAQRHEQQQQQQPFRSCGSMVATAGGATHPRTTRTNAPPSPSQTWTTGWTLTRRRVRACAAGQTELNVGGSSKKARRQTTRTTEEQRDHHRDYSSGVKLGSHGVSHGKSPAALVRVQESSEGSSGCHLRVLPRRRLGGVLIATTATSMFIKTMHLTLPQT